MRMFCVVPMYKNLDIEAIDSIANQTYMPFRVVVINDDCGNGADIATKYYVNNVPFDILSRKNRCYAMKNIYDGIKLLDATYKLSDDDIIVLVDGDDTLYDNTVLSTVYKEYKQHNCWLTYGSYINKSDYSKGAPYRLHRGDYRNDENYRKTEWRASHLKTFKYGLFKQIKEHSFKDASGEWLRTCSDLAIMFPMLEMAGRERIRHIDKPLYIYNDLSPINDHKVAGKEQAENDRWLRIQEPYKKIKKSL